MFKFSQRSIKNLDGVHHDIAAVAALALTLTSVDFVVIEGVRNRRRQEQLVAEGASWTMNSRHLTGHAIDVAALDTNGEVSWSWPLYYEIAAAFKEAAKRLNIDINWGGDWRGKKKDGPHFQLSWKKYPFSLVSGETSELKKVA